MWHRLLIVYYQHDLCFLPVYCIDLHYNRTFSSLWYRTTRNLVLLTRLELLRYTGVDQNIRIISKASFSSCKYRCKYFVNIYRHLILILMS